MAKNTVPERKGAIGDHRIAGKEKSSDHYQDLDLDNVKLKVKKQKAEPLNSSRFPKKHAKLNARNSSNFVYSIPRRSQGSNAGCFVATAAFGSPMQADVQFLRNYRDRCLRQYFLGRKFISFYQKNGPYGAALIQEREWLKRPVRRCLKLLISIIQLGWKG